MHLTAASLLAPGYSTKGQYSTRLDRACSPTARRCVRLQIWCPFEGCIRVRKAARNDLMITGQLHRLKDLRPLGRRRIRGDGKLIRIRVANLNRFKSRAAGKLLCRGRDREQSRLQRREARLSGLYGFEAGLLSGNHILVIDQQRIDQRRGINPAGEPGTRFDRSHSLSVPTVCSCETDPWRRHPNPVSTLICPVVLFSRTNHSIQTPPVTAARSQVHLPLESVFEFRPHCYSSK